jgi:hypothetical protein
MNEPEAIPRIAVTGELRKFPDGIKLVDTIHKEVSQIEPAPLGKTRLADGSVIDSINRMFVLAPAKEDKNILSFGDGKTFYRREKNGMLRRLTPKGKK